MTTGARAMSTALVLQADDRRKDGRWRRRSVVGNDESVTSGSAWAQRLKECGVVLDFKPDLAGAVVAGEIRESFTGKDSPGDGRWKYGSVQTDANGDSSTSSAWIKAVQNAGVVLDFKPDLAAAVVAGEVAS